MATQTIRRKPVIVPIPGQPGESVAQAILGDLEQLIKAYKVKVTDGYSTSSVHAPNGDHPSGLGVDLVPDFARGGTWDDVDKAAAMAKSRPDVFRWVGYDGVPNHGRGNHLHLSWHGGPSDPPGTKIKTLFGDPTGGPVVGGYGLTRGIGKIVAGAGAAIKGGGKQAGDAATDAAGDAAAAGLAAGVVALLVERIGVDGTRVLLSIALVGTAVAAIGFGAARMVGLRAPLPPVAALAKTASKGSS